MSSVSTARESVTDFDELLGDILVYSLAAAAGQTISHMVLARDPRLPADWKELMVRYVAGSGINWVVHLTYALRHRHATARHGALVHGGILAACGAVVGVLHMADHLHDRAVARARDESYDREDAGHVVRSATTVAFPVSRLR